MVEVVFSYLVSRRLLSESFTRPEKGMALMLVGLVLISLQGLYEGDNPRRRPPPTCPARPAASPTRTWDAFYASVELLRYPQRFEACRWSLAAGAGNRTTPWPRSTASGWPTFPSRPFLVLRDYVGRGVITTATYAARPVWRGLGHGLMKAARASPAGHPAAGGFC